MATSTAASGNPKAEKSPDRNPEQKPAPKSERKPAETFRYEQVICTRRTNEAVPGPDTAALTAATQAGWRPIGTPTAEVHPDADHVNVLVVWTVPVEAA